MSLDSYLRNEILHTTIRIVNLQLYAKREMWLFVLSPTPTHKVILLVTNSY
jgi:hypothetical protein